MARQESAVPRTAIARTARSRRTRGALVDAVRVELQATGSFTADLVAARAGCSTATFYSHFATKDDALVAAFDLVLHDLAEQTTQLFTTSRLKDGLDGAIAELVDRQAAFFRKESLVFRAALARLPESRDLRNVYRQAEVANLEHLRSVVSDAQSLGLIRVAPADLLAEAILVLAQGINNPRLLPPAAGNLRSEITTAILSIIGPRSAS